MTTIAEKFNNFKTTVDEKFRDVRGKAYKEIDNLDRKIDKVCKQKIKNQKIAKLASRILKALPLILLQVLTATLAHPLVGIAVTAGLGIAAGIARKNNYWKTGRTMFDTFGASMGVLTVVRTIQAIATGQFFPYVFVAILRGAMSGTSFFFAEQANKKATSFPVKV